MNLLPNLFIVGAPKAGTSFLYEKLKSHPSLFFTAIKEVNHFSFKNLVNDSYYKDYKIKDRISYLSCFKKSSIQKYLVDSSVSYFAYSEVPELIYKFNPSSKIIIILRDPFARAFSHYLMDIRMGYAKLPFSEYLGKKGPYFTQYVGNSLYGKNIKNYLKYFDKKNVLVLKLEEIDSQLDRLFDFLEIENYSASIDVNDKVNSNKKAKNFIASYFQKNRLITEKLKLILPISLVKFANNFLYKEADNSLKLNGQDINILKEYLYPDLELLEKLNVGVSFKEIRVKYD